jgi:hypothetical protein
MGTIILTFAAEIASLNNPRINPELAIYVYTWLLL